MMSLVVASTTLTVVAAMGYLLQVVCAILAVFSLIILFGPRWHLVSRAFLALTFPILIGTALNVDFPLTMRAKYLVIAGAGGFLGAILLMLSERRRRERPAGCMPSRLAVVNFLVTPCIVSVYVIIALAMSRL